MHKGRMEAFSDGVLLFAALAYLFLARALVRVHGRDSAFARALGGDAKGIASLVAYVVAVALAAVAPKVSCALYVAVAIAWLVPDRRFARVHEGHAA